MNKNLIYMVAINHHTSQFKVTDYSRYSVPLWKNWCDRNDVDFMVITEHDDRFDKPIWNKELIFQNIGSEYDKIGIVDADTIPKWNMPNVFDQYTDEFCGVVDNSSFYFLYHSINAYGKFFNGIELDTDEYINAGVVFFTKEHKHFFDEMLKFYFENKDELDNWNIPNTGREQTIFNFMLKKLNIKQKYLPPVWNLFGMHKKDMFAHNYVSGDETPYFLRYGYIWHFTGFPIENRIKIMKNVYEQLGNLYE